MNSKKQQKSCPVCSDETFEWGQLRSQGLVYLKDDSTWLKKQFTLGDKLKARRCISCDNIQIFVA